MMDDYVTVINVKTLNEGQIHLWMGRVVGGLPFLSSTGVESCRLKHMSLGSFLCMCIIVCVYYHPAAALYLSVTRHSRAVVDASNRVMTVTCQGGCRRTTTTSNTFDDLLLVDVLCVAFSLLMQ